MGASLRVTIITGKNSQSIPDSPSRNGNPSRCPFVGMDSGRERAVDTAGKIRVGVLVDPTHRPYPVRHRSRRFEKMPRGGLPAAAEPSPDGRSSRMSPPAALQMLSGGLHTAPRPLLAAQASEVVAGAERDPLRVERMSMEEIGPELVLVVSAEDETVP
jgi:hypothetical protein